MADRICVDQYVADNIYPLIDKSRFLKLKDRADVFMFAVAIGVHKGQRKELAEPVKFMNASSLSSDNQAMIYAIAISDSDDADRDAVLANMDLVYSIAQEYASVGFDQIKLWIDDMNRDYSSVNMDTQLYRCLREMDSVMRTIEIEDGSEESEDGESEIEVDA